MKKIIFSLITISLLFIACDKTEESTALTKNFLQGQWVDNGDNQFDLGGVKYRFEFNNNEFKLHISEYTDLRLVNCNNINSWDNYMKGTFIIENNSIILTGNYCDSQFQIKTDTDCEEVMPIGEYGHTFELKIKDKRTITFKNKLGKTTTLLKN